MFGRKILFLAAGYVAGNVVSTLYTNWKKWKKQQGISWAFQSFVDTHEKMIDTASKSYLTKDQQKKFSSLSSKMKDTFLSLSTEGKSLMRDISKNESLQWIKKSAKKNIKNVSESGRKTAAKISEKVLKDSNKF